MFCVFWKLFNFFCLHSSESKISNLSACPMYPSSPDAVMASNLSSGKPGKTIYDHCQNYLKPIRGANFFFHRRVRSQYLVLGGKTVLWSISFQKWNDSSLFRCWRSWKPDKSFPNARVSTTSLQQSNARSVRMHLNIFFGSKEMMGDDVSTKREYFQCLKGPIGGLQPDFTPGNWTGGDNSG